MKLTIRNNGEEKILFRAETDGIYENAVQDLDVAIINEHAYVRRSRTAPKYEGIIRSFRQGYVMNTPIGWMPIWHSCFDDRYVFELD